MGRKHVFGGCYKFRIVMSFVEDSEISGSPLAAKQIKLQLE